MQFVFQDKTFCGKIHADLTEWMEKKRREGDVYVDLTGKTIADQEKIKTRCKNKRSQFYHQFRNLTKNLCQNLSNQLKDEYREFVNDYHIFHIPDISGFMPPGENIICSCNSQMPAERQDEAFPIPAPRMPAERQDDPPPCTKKT